MTRDRDKQPKPDRSDDDLPKKTELPEDNPTYWDMNHLIADGWLQKIPRIIVGKFRLRFDDAEEVAQEVLRKLLEQFQAGKPVRAAWILKQIEWSVYASWKKKGRKTEAKQLGDFEPQQLNHRSWPELEKLGQRLQDDRQRKTYLTAIRMIQDDEKCQLDKGRLAETLGMSRPTARKVLNAAMALVMEEL